MKRARVIYNPKSGKEQVTQKLPYILERLEHAGFEASAHATTADPEDAAREAGRAADRAFDLVVAAGGDGTIHDVVNGLAPMNGRRLSVLSRWGRQMIWQRLSVCHDRLLQPVIRFVRADRWR